MRASGPDAQTREPPTTRIAEYHVILEFDSESGHYTGTVARFPSIVVDTKSEREALRLAKEAIAWHVESAPEGASKALDVSTVHAKVVTVDVE